MARLAHGRERDRPHRRRTACAPTSSVAAAENVKRVVLAEPDAQSLYEISAFLELKTVWHPIGHMSAFDDTQGHRAAADLGRVVAPRR